MDRIHSLAARLYRHIRRPSTHSRFPHTRRPMAYWRHYLWHRVLHHWAGAPLWIQRKHLQRDTTLDRWTVLLHAVHLIERDDGLQVLGFDCCVFTCLFFSFLFVLVLVF